MSLQPPILSSSSPSWVEGPQRASATRRVTSWRELPDDVREDFARIDVDETRYAFKNGVVAVEIGMIGLAERGRSDTLLRLFHFLQADGSGVDVMNVRTGPLTHGGLARRVPQRIEKGQPYLGMSAVRLTDEWALEAPRPSVLLQWWRHAAKPRNSVEATQRHLRLTQGFYRFTLPGDAWRHRASQNPPEPVVVIGARLRQAPSVYCWDSAQTWTALTPTHIAGLGPSGFAAFEYDAIDRVGFSASQGVLEVNAHAFWAPPTIGWKMAALLGLLTTR